MICYFDVQYILLQQYYTIVVTLVCYSLCVHTAKQVDEGETRLKAFFGTHEVKDKTCDLCTVLPVWNSSCPLHPGNVKVIGLYNNSLHCCIHVCSFSTRHPS